MKDEDYLASDASVEVLSTFHCGTQEMQETPDPMPQSNSTVSAISSNLVCARIEHLNVIPYNLVKALREDGTWADVGEVATDRSFFNPSIPMSYALDSGQRMQLLAGIYTFSVSIKPVLTNLSLRIRDRIHVNGSTSARLGVVEAYSEGRWKGIASVQPDGTFSNPDLPPSYLLKPETVRVRITNAMSSDSVDATNDYIHPRSMEFLPTLPAPVEQQLRQWRLQKADYQPTGYRIPAQGTIEVLLEGNDEDVTLLVGTQGLAEPNERSKQTPNMRRYPLKRGMNTVSDPLGGVIHLRHVGNLAKGPIRIILNEAARPIAYYRARTTAESDWLAMRSKSAPSDEIQMVGDKVVITAYADTYSRFGSIDAVESHEEVLRLEDEASGLDGSTPLHTRSLFIHAVESRSGANPHATTGYIGLPHGSNDGNAYMSALVGGLAHNRWVTLHEYGHHYQSFTNTGYPLFDEISVNIYALAVHRVHDNEYTAEFPKRWAHLEKWLAQPRALKNYLESPDPQALFEQLRIKFGDSLLPRWDRYSREKPVSRYDIRHLFVSLSQAAGHNLANFFADWGALKENDNGTWQALRALHLPLVPKDVIKIVPYT